MALRVGRSFVIVVALVCRAHRQLQAKKTDLQQGQVRRRRSSSPIAMVLIVLAVPSPFSWHGPRSCSSSHGFPQPGSSFRRPEVEENALNLRVFHNPRGMANRSSHLEILVSLLNYNSFAILLVLLTMRMAALEDSIHDSTRTPFVRRHRRPLSPAFTR